MRIKDAKHLLREVVVYNMECFQAGKRPGHYIVPFFVGDPGIGKTAIPKQVAAEMGIDEFQYWQAIIGQLDAGEMAGIQFPIDAEKTDEHGKTVLDDDGNPVMTKILTRMRPDYLPTGEMGIFNLDELAQAFLANLNITSQIVNEWRVGPFPISQGITICATSNKPENKAGTTTLPSHLDDRLMKIEIECNLDDTLEHAAIMGWDFRVRAYLRENPGHLHKFQVGAKGNPNPRNWEKTSTVMKLDLPKRIRQEAIAGHLGDGEAVQFETYIEKAEEMPKISEILSSPETAPTFGNDKADILYLLLANLSEVASEKTIKPIIQYVNRLENQEFAIYWGRETLLRHEELRDHDAMIEWKVSDANPMLR